MSDPQQAFVGGFSSRLTEATSTSPGQDTSPSAFNGQLVSGSLYTQEIQDALKSVSSAEKIKQDRDSNGPTSKKSNGGRIRRTKSQVRSLPMSRPSSSVNKSTPAKTIDDSNEEQRGVKSKLATIEGTPKPQDPDHDVNTQSTTAKEKLESRRPRIFRKINSDDSPSYQAATEAAKRRASGLRTAMRNHLLRKQKARSARLIKVRKIKAWKLERSSKDKESQPSIAPIRKLTLKEVKSSAFQSKVGGSVRTVDAGGLQLSPILTDQPPVPSLAYGLDRVLFNSGVHTLQDPRSRVFNFDPYLQNIMPVNEFDFAALKKYVTSSEDKSLRQIAQEHQKKYSGSTSSMTGILAHFHYLVSQWRPVNLDMLSRGFPVQSEKFTELLRSPSVIFLRYQDGTYAIDADKEFDRGNVLSLLGKSMEKFLCLEPQEYEKYRKSNSAEISEAEKTAPEAFHYSTMGDFLMRSQLDAYDARLPGTGMFDLKTRAVVSIRMDVSQYEEGVGYEIKERFGEWESYEREYYDMIRAAFLKYSLQVRMGRMDGIFVAHHNVERIFGFQYIGIDEMDLALHGQKDTSLGDQEFMLSVDLLNQVLNRATERFPKTSIRLHFETREAVTPFMYIFAEPYTEDGVDDLQSRHRAAIEEFERRAFGDIDKETPDLAKDESRWEDMEASIQASMNQDEKGIDDDSVTLEQYFAQKQIPVRPKRREMSKTETNVAKRVDAASAANESVDKPRTLPSDLESNGEFETDADQPFLEEIKGQDTEEIQGEVLAMTLTIRNKVNGEYTTRPEKMCESDKWEVEYSLVERTDAVKAWALYEACKARRAKKLGTAQPDGGAEKISRYIGDLRQMSKAGKRWRKSRDAMDQARPLQVLGKP